MKYLMEHGAFDAMTECQGRDARSFVYVAACHGPREMRGLLGSKAGLKRPFRVLGKKWSYE